MPEVRHGCSGSEHPVEPWLPKRVSASVVEALSNMVRITPRQFKQSFLKAVTTAASDVVTLWDVRRDFTALMLDVIFPNIALDLGIFVYSANYYYLDSIFYSERDSDHFAPSSTYAKCINIAVEHEHDITGTAVEMNKLQLFNAPLKVLITYAQTSSLREFYLDRYAKIIRSADVFGDIATHRRQVVVFGSLPETCAVWHFYEYEATGFREVDCESVMTPLAPVSQQSPVSSV